jgi:DNA-binding transcriptional ArsR family regulator
MSSNSIMIDLDDARSERIAEVLSNKTSKKILQALAEGEKSASDVASQLKLPLNTVTYNLKKLTEAGLIEKAKGFFWSQKGKKMEMYKVANRKIVIMPKQMVKGILPAVIVTGIAAIGIKLWTFARIQSGEMVTNFVKDEGTLKIATESASDAVGSGVAAPRAMMDASQGIAGLCGNETVLNIAQSTWLWFFTGALIALFVYLVWNFWRRR